VFSNISETFNRVLNTGLIVKLEAADVHGLLLSWFSNNLQSCSERAVLFGTISYLMYIQAGKPKGSIL